MVFPAKKTYIKSLQIAILRSGLFFFFYFAGIKPFPFQYLLVINKTSNSTNANLAAARLRGGFRDNILYGKGFKGEGVGGISAFLDE